MKSKRELALQRAFTDPERMASIHKAGIERHGGRWLTANIAAVNAANATGLNAEAHKVPISQIVLRVLDTTLTAAQRKAIATRATDRNANG